MKTNLIFCFLFFFFLSNLYSQEEALKIMTDSAQESTHKETPVLRDKTITFVSEYENILIAKKENGTGNSRFALLDSKTKKEITPFVFDEISSFYLNFYFLVRINNFYGIIDRSGAYLLPCICKSIEPIFYNRALFIQYVKNGYSGIIDLNKNDILPPVYDKIESIPNGNFFILQQDNISEVKDIFTEKTYFTGNFTEIEYVKNRTSEAFIVQYKGKYNLVNIDGKLLLPNWVDHLAPNYHSLDNNLTISTDNRCGLIDLQGNAICPIEYNEICPYDLANKQYYLVSKDGKKGVLDEKGHITLPLQYSSFKRLDSEKAILVASQDNKYGVVSLDGKVVIPFEYSSIRKGGKNTFIVKKDSYFGLIDSSGNYIIPLKYDKINLILSDSRISREQNIDFYLVATGNNMGIMDNFGNERIKPLYSFHIKLEFLYDESAYEAFLYYPFSVKSKKGKYGVLDIDEKILIPFEYDDITYINSFLRIVSQKGKYGIVNVFNGKFVLPIKYEFINHYGDDSGSIIAFKDGKYESYNIHVNSLHKNFDY